MYMAISSREKQKIIKLEEDQQVENKRGRKSEKPKNFKHQDVGDILKGHHFKQWNDGEKKTETESDEDYSTYSISSNASYDIETRIYKEELLTDPAIETLERFNIGTIRQNQREFVQHQIITRILKGQDTKKKLMIY